jgi:hypothetical protein
MALIFLEGVDGVKGWRLVATGDSIMFDEVLDSNPPTQESLENLSVDDLKVLASRACLFVKSRATRSEIAQQIIGAWTSVLNGATSYSLDASPTASKDPLDVKTALELKSCALELGIKYCIDTKSGKRKPLDRSNKEELKTAIRSVGDVETPTPTQAVVRSEPSHTMPPPSCDIIATVLKIQKAWQNFKNSKMNSKLIYFTVQDSKSFSFCVRDDWTVEDVHTSVALNLSGNFRLTFAGEVLQMDKLLSVTLLWRSCTPLAL